MKIFKRIGLCIVLAAVILALSLLRDKQYLRDRILRIHIVANSDSQEDQQIKLAVRDAVLNSISMDLEQISDVEAAKEYLRNNLQNIQKIASEVLESAGFPYKAKVSLYRETFDTRDHESYSLPAGSYHALMITLGEGDGKNWWCVVFPEFYSAAGDADSEEAFLNADILARITGTVRKEQGYQYRFFLLDILGKAENLLLGK